jgi:hypothetical protein
MSLRTYPTNDGLTINEFVNMFVENHPAEATLGPDT